MVYEKFFGENGHILGKFTKGAKISFDLDRTFWTPAELSWFCLAIINIQLEKTQSSARTPGRWRNRKVVESMSLTFKNFRGSTAFEASKNTACTEEPWVTKYEAVCFNKNVHWSVLWLALKPNWLSVVPRKGEMLDNMKCSSSFDTTLATATGL